MGLISGGNENVLGFRCWHNLVRTLKPLKWDVIYISILKNVNTVKKDAGCCDCSE